MVALRGPLSFRAAVLCVCGCRKAAGTLILTTEYYTYWRERGFTVNVVQTCF